MTLDIISITSFPEVVRDVTNQEFVVVVAVTNNNDEPITGELTRLLHVDLCTVTISGLTLLSSFLPNSRRYIYIYNPTQVEAWGMMILVWQFT